MAQQWDPELLAGFFEEASEDVEQLEARLVALKSNPNDEAAIGQAFRTIHSIKGNTGFFGIKNANHFCDRFENLLDHLRSAIGDVTTATVDLLLRGLDEIRAMLAEAEAGKRSSELTEVQERILEEVATHCVEETIVVSAGLVRELAAMIKSEPFAAAVEANAQLEDIRTAFEKLAKSVDAECDAPATDPSHDVNPVAVITIGSPMSSLNAIIAPIAARSAVLNSSVVASFGSTAVAVSLLLCVPEDPDTWLVLKNGTPSKLLKPAESPLASNCEVRKSLWVAAR